MRVACIMLMVLGLVAFGCTQRKVAVPDEQVTDTQKQAQQEAVPAKPKDAAGEGQKQSITEQQIAKIESKDVPPRVEELSGIFKDIFFDYDKYDVRDDAQTVLKSIGTYLTKNTGHKVLIEGHCDDRGTNEYNLGLGDRRTKSVKDYLVSIGVPSSRIETISYGEEKPVCSEQSDACRAKNRRAHFVVLKGK